MRVSPWPYVVIALLGGLAALLLIRQHRITVQLQNEIFSKRAEAVKEARLHEEHRKLVAQQVSPAELEELRAERASIAALRSEIEKMKRRAEASARTMAAAPPQHTSAATLGDGPIAAQFWKNAGRATPEFALETALWAAAGGDVDTLTGLLLFEPEAQSKADGIFERLPAALRQELGTSRQLIALMVAKDAPLSSAQIIDRGWAEGGAQLKTLLTDEQGKSKSTQFSLRLEGTSWRFIVPARAVERYAAQLQAPVGPPQSR